MNLTYISMEDKYLTPSANLVEEVFTEYENEKEGKRVFDYVQEVVGIPAWQQRTGRRLQG